MSTLSLSQYLCREQQLHDLDPVLSRLIVSVSEACKTISFKVRNGALAGVLGMAGSENVQGEDQKKLDIISNDIFVEAVALSGSVCGMVSEEIPEVIPVPEDLPIGPYLICFDPLDGSSNIDINVSIGSIFSVLPAVRPKRARCRGLPDARHQAGRRRLLHVRSADPARPHVRPRRRDVHA